MVLGAPWIINNCPLRQVVLWGGSSSESILVGHRRTTVCCVTSHGLDSHQGLLFSLHRAEVCQGKGPQESGQKAGITLSQEERPWQLPGTGALTERDRLTAACAHQPHVNCCPRQQEP